MFFRFPSHVLDCASVQWSVRRWLCKCVCCFVWNTTVQNTLGKGFTCHSYIWHRPQLNTFTIETLLHVNHLITAKYLVCSWSFHTSSCGETGERQIKYLIPCSPCACSLLDSFVLCSLGHSAGPKVSAVPAVLLRAADKCGQVLSGGCRCKFTQSQNSGQVVAAYCGLWCDVACHDTELTSFGCNLKFLFFCRAK